MDERTSAWTPRLKSKTDVRARDVIFQPNVHRRMLRGIDQIVDAIRPTLGPLPRVVAITPMYSQKAPELLDSGGLIARRIIELGDRDEDMGAMLARAMICGLHDDVGDGTATAAVLFRSIYAQGIHYLASGGNAMRLRLHLEGAVELILNELALMTQAVEGQEQLTRIAQAICYDQPLAQLLGEIFAVVGAFGQLDVRANNSRTLECDYLDGMTWASGLFSRQMFTDPGSLMADVEDAAILITDQHIDDPRELMPAIVLAMESGYKALVIVTRKLSENAMAGFALANRHPDKFQTFAVKLPGGSPDEQAAAMDDIAILTGAQPIIGVAGQSLKYVRAEMFGQARRIWATTANFGIIGGKGDKDRLRAHLERLHSQFDREDKLDTRKQLQERIGKLIGGSATLWVGASTQAEMASRRALAERSAELLRGAMLDGVLPGGGVALLACRSLIEQKLAQAVDVDERAAYRIVRNALSEPTRALIANAGYEPSAVMAETSLCGPGFGFDVVAAKPVKMANQGILDSAHVIREAVFSAVSTAALALTIDVFVHHRHRQLVQEPG